ncbi:short-chain collagen C4-like [Mercenaria mercenaria]|uniref:short-chain collagen C4-like n=1 Tax=Mercenaria mercenaria TaxID=6596 RepID=UPI00234ECF0F|nr:short-chain collagen C4-like [Mercenaria mercenaria]
MYANKRKMNNLLCIILFRHILHVLAYSEEPKCYASCDYQILKTVIQLEQKLNNMELTVQKQQDVINKLSTVGHGAVYVRWGRNVCPDGSSLVYNGYTAGKHYNKKGSGGDTICLPSNPSWSNYTGKSSLKGLIFGTEIDLNDPSGIFPYSVHQQDMPCVVCRSQRSSILMVPAQNNCFSGWHVEYTGYLMAGMDDRLGSYNHICMDSQPEFIPNGSGNNNQHILYVVQAQCGSLPCPPYVQGRELACVVCSK